MFSSDVYQNTCWLLPDKMASMTLRSSSILLMERGKRTSDEKCRKWHACTALHWNAAECFAMI